MRSKQIFYSVLVLMFGLGLLAGPKCSAQTNSKAIVFAELGAGWKLGTSSDVTLPENGGGDNPTALLVVGVRWPESGWRIQLEDNSQWFSGWPFNDEGEVATQQIKVVKRWDLWYFGRD